MLKKCLVGLMILISGSVSVHACDQVLKEEDLVMLIDAGDPCIVVSNAGYAFHNDYFALTDEGLVLQTAYYGNYLLQQKSTNDHILAIDKHQIWKCSQCGRESATPKDGLCGLLLKNGERCKGRYLPKYDLGW